MNTKMDVAWNFDYFKKALSYLLAVILSFGAVLSGGTGDVLPANTPSTALTQTQVVLSEKKFDPQTALFAAMTTEMFLVPGLAEGLIPQGIAYAPDAQVYLISGYFEESLPSMIAVLDENGVLLHAVTVKTANGALSEGHFGGVAVFRDFVYLANTSGLFVLSLQELLQAENGAAVDAKAELNTCLPATSGAEVANGVLWLTEFVENAGSVLKEKTPVYRTKYGETFYARADGYVLDEAAPLGIREASVKDGTALPDMALAIPPEVQGMTVLPDGRLLFCCSYGRKNDSFVLLFKDVLSKKATQTLDLDDTSVPLRFCRLADRLATVTALPMLQEVTVGADGAVYMLSESGAAKYRTGGGIAPIDHVLQLRIG